MCVCKTSSCSFSSYDVHAGVCVIQVTNPSLPSFFHCRLTEKPTKVGPYLVPAGVNLLPSLFVIHNYTGNWGPDALEFKPERWQEPSVGVDPISKASCFLPFSAGPKKCIGLALGQVVVRSAVALMLSTFT